MSIFAQTCLLAKVTKDHNYHKRNQKKYPESNIGAQRISSGVKPEDKSKDHSKKQDADHRYLATNFPKILGVTLDAQKLRRAHKNTSFHYPNSSAPQYKSL
jgi:hypothetical protein